MCLAISLMRFEVDVLLFRFGIKTSGVIIFFPSIYYSFSHYLKINFHFQHRNSGKDF